MTQKPARVQTSPKRKEVFFLLPFVAFQVFTVEC